MVKTDREIELCKGLANSPDCGRKYFVAWEQGKLGATAPDIPILNPDGFCNKAIGFGGNISRTIERVTAGLVQPCGSCKGRAAVLDHWFPGQIPPVLPMEFSQESKRHFLMHIWPVKDLGAWQWNCDQVLKRASLFNGKRIIAIVYDHATDSADAVQNYMQDFADDVIVMKNKATRREGTTFVPLFEKLEQFSGPTDVTFYCHAKAVRHKVPTDSSVSTLFRWTGAMYETLLDDWPSVEDMLRTKAMAGSFRRFGMFNTRRNYQWHYSGTFRWSRNLDFYQRNWRYIDSQFFAAESHVGHMFRPEEVGCIFADNCGDLYRLDYWNSDIEPQLKAWRELHATTHSG